MLQELKIHRQMKFSYYFQAPVVCDKNAVKWSMLWKPRRDDQLYASQLRCRLQDKILSRLLVISGLEHHSFKLHPRYICILNIDLC